MQEILSLIQVFSKMSIFPVNLVSKTAWMFVQSRQNSFIAGLELGCVVNDIRHIIVCGHSDCKAMNLLHQLQDPEFSSRHNRIMSPLRSWLMSHAATSLEKFKHLLDNGNNADWIQKSENTICLVVQRLLFRSWQASVVHRWDSTQKIHRLYWPWKQICHRGQTLSNKYASTASKRRVLRFSKKKTWAARFTHSRIVVRYLHGWYLLF